MFLGYIHYFRALAIFFIVAGHSMDAFTWHSKDIERIIRIIFSNGSVLFVFIAGYLLLQATFSSIYCQSSLRISIINQKLPM